jgi:hypothetical protein
MQIERVLEYVHDQMHVSNVRIVYTSDVQTIIVKLMYYNYSQTHVYRSSVTIVEYIYSHQSIADKSCKMTYNNITFKTIHLIVDALIQTAIHSHCDYIIWRMRARKRHSLDW